jgi:C-terminal processing protease CtpA/Prc
MLGDHHSYLQLTPALQREEAARKPQLANPSAMQPVTPARKPSFPFPSPFRTRRVPEGAMVANAQHPIAHVVLPLFASPDRKEVDAFATQVQTVIRDLAAHDPCGWIVDLRGNGGGNIWAMRAGIGPILGEGSAGGRENAEGVKTFSFYAGAAAGERENGEANTYAAVAGTPLVVRGTPPVAVLIDRETGSSGEGIAIDFRGRPSTRFFGETTYGASTSTFPFALSDSAQLYLVTGVMIDRAGNEFEFGVSPDEEILSEATISNNDPVIGRAAAWLTEQTACTSRR